jgi:hypothetical protein
VTPEEAAYLRELFFRWTQRKKLPYVRVEYQGRERKWGIPYELPDEAILPVDMTIQSPVVQGFGNYGHSREDAETIARLAVELGLKAKEINEEANTRGSWYDVPLCQDSGGTLLSYIPVSACMPAR